MGPLSIIASSANQPSPPDLEHTPDHADCPACRRANIALQAEKVNISSMAFNNARNFWTLLRGQSSSLKQRTHETDTQYMNALAKFFGRIELRNITPGHLRAYQLARLGNHLRIAGQDVQPWRNAAGHSLINHELALLGRILRHCRLWARIRPYYFPLDIPKWSPRQVLSEEDEAAFFKAAAADPEAGLAYWIAAITTNTSASGIELRGLRLKHIFLREDHEISEIYVPEDSVKNESRPRKIPLNPLAKWAVGRCYQRALELGSCEPDHYLFPFRDRRLNRYVPERPPSRWVFRRSWDKLRKATGFSSLKPHDLRFLCITKMLETGQDPEIVQAVAGHVSPRMMEYYGQPRRKRKYAAVMAIAGKKKPPATARPSSRKRTGS